MPSRADVNRYRSALDRAVELGQAELAKAFGALRSLPPEVARDGLIEVLETIGVRYGDMAGAAAAEFYEEQRQAAYPGRVFNARIAEPVTREEAEGSVRHAATHLFGTHQGDTLTALNGSLQRYIENTARRTISLNAARDATRPRWARVPGGARTCAWCLMLSSRGWVYSSETTAGGGANSFHDEDRCLIVPSWERRPQLDGYDPEAMRELYDAARSEVVSDGIWPDDRAIALRLRDMFPDQFTDGRAVPSILTDVTYGWSPEISPVTPGRWRHILNRHGRQGTAVDLFDGMTDYEIAKAIRATIIAPDLTVQLEEWVSMTNLHKSVDGIEVIVGVRLGKDGQRTVRTAFPPNAKNRRL